MRARYYDPVTGRFSGEDPAHNGLNWFAYCDNNPIHRADFDGRNWADVIGLLYIAYGMNGMYHNVQALLTFWNAVDNATDPLDVENAWGQFMETWAANADGGAIGAAIDRVTAVGGKLLSYNSSTFVSALMNGANLAIMTIGYNLRLEYYVNLE